jgi:hypothetical protein
MKRDFNIKKDVRHCYRIYVAIIKPFLRGIRDREADVFAELLYFNYIKKDIPDVKDRFKIILDGDIRKEIIKYLGISDDVYRNMLTSLRKRELITRDNTINEIYFMYPTKGEFSINFNLKMEV